MQEIVVEDVKTTRSNAGLDILIHDQYLNRTSTRPKYLSIKSWKLHVLKNILSYYTECFIKNIVVLRLYNIYYTKLAVTNHISNEKATQTALLKSL